ncbi:PTB domain-containing engulfment adapter protein 1 isoform X2 [Danio rerio]|uniref:PTB domain-containing engulfment adapter protein 1 n=1 Tax=Danio rerio TaxID=7955 RepID=E7FG11_DANRE|nr:PTB domain-containing engulfment adapter protein 1 isoform X2 [Danio rerio]|eukprot:XP_009300486.1 PTB domain-containing engulfment adapter protein 1 isoform X2 [Danio rerio]
MRLDGLRVEGNNYKINLPCGLTLESALSLQALLKLCRMNRAFNRRKDKPSMHTPEALVKSHVVYNAKFLGITEVDQPKGTDMVRVAVRKLKFQRHIKKSEGHKTPKVELQISIYGVKILDPKTKEMLHNCQLHRMSFCADDKTDKRIFTFICTEPETKKHLCYVFDSEKCAEEITLAIGQAFDLAYKKFLESGGKDVETRKQIGNLQKRIQDLEMENSKLKKKLKELEDQLTDPRCSPRASTLSWCGEDVTSLSSLEISSVTLTPVSSPDSSQSASLLTPPPAKPTHSQPKSDYIVPRPRTGSIQARAPSTDIFDMVPFTPESPITRRLNFNGFSSPYLTPKDTDIDLFGAEPFDPFICGPTVFTPDMQSKLDEMQEGFQMGLTLEGTVFSLEPVDSRC